MDIKEILKNKLKNLTQKQVLEIVEIQPSYCWFLENGRVISSVKVFLKLEEVLDFTIYFKRNVGCFYVSF